MVTDAARAAFHCQSGVKVNEPHYWDYRRNDHTYRCKNCLVVFTKAELKEATDA